VAVADLFLDETFAVTRVEELLRALIGVFRLGRALLREGCFVALWDTEVDRFLGEAFAIPRLDTVAALVFELRFFPPRVFFLPARLSTKAVTALDATSIAAFTFAVAALAIASSAAALRPSFSMSIIMPSPRLSGKRHIVGGSIQAAKNLCKIWPVDGPQRIEGRAQRGKRGRLATCWVFKRNFTLAA